jgi:hypothetical protein
VKIRAAVALMKAAGWREGFDPTFTIVFGVARNAVYILRLAVGVAMLASSLDWLIDVSTLLRESTIDLTNPAQEVTASTVLS